MPEGAISKVDVPLEKISELSQRRRKELDDLLVSHDIKPQIIGIDYAPKFPFLIPLYSGVLATMERVTHKRHIKLARAEKVRRMQACISLFVSEPPLPFRDNAVYDIVKRARQMKWGTDGMATVDIESTLDGLDNKVRDCLETETRRMFADDADRLANELTKTRAFVQPFLKFLHEVVDEYMTLYFPRK